MSRMTLTIKDETFAGKVLNEIEISLASERATVKDIIEARVTAEVEAYNQKLPEYFQGLVQPTDSEATLNGYRQKDRKKVDAERQVYAALNAFLKNGYFVLVDNRQAESLEEEILIGQGTQISFVKLTPLVGG